LKPSGEALHYTSDHMSTVLNFEITEAQKAPAFPENANEWHDEPESRPHGQNCKYVGAKVFMLAPSWIGGLPLSYEKNARRCDNQSGAFGNLLKLPNGNWRVRGVLRGVYDTVPQTHYAGDYVFFITSGHYANVTRGGYVAAAGQETAEQYNITTESIDEKEPFDHAKIRELATTRRAERPNPPGRFRATWHNQALPQCLVSKVAGDFAASWTPRNKDFQFGAASQDDAVEYWSNAEFVPPDGIGYEIEIEVDGGAKLYQTAETHFTYTWEQRCGDFPGKLSARTAFRLYSALDGLRSRQSHERTFAWTVPFIADIAETEAEAAERIAAWGMTDRIAIPAGPVSTEKQILYGDLPIVLIGHKVGSFEEHDTLLSWQGEYFKPDGVCLIVHSPTSHERYEMRPDYVFGTYFIQTATGGRLLYRWDGGGAILEQDGA
jgi:hypothetical protein